MYKIACFVSGNGSNLKAIFEEIAKGNLLTEISLVVSNKSDCNAVKFAEVNAIETFIIAKDSSNYSELINILLNKKIDLIVLAGFLKKIPFKLSGLICQNCPAFTGSYYFIRKKT